MIQNDKFITMKKYTIIKETGYWTTESLRQNVQFKVNKLAQDGYEIVSVAFGTNMWAFPTVFITIAKEESTI